MATQVTNYKCPACTGPLHFVGASGKLECDYCGGAYEVNEIEARLKEQNEQAAAAMEASANSRWDMGSLTKEWGGETQGMKVYGCPSCGAELICDATTAATCCPYCGNQTVVPGQFSGSLRPEYVIPFKTDKEQAKAALLAHYKGKWLLPKSFVSGNHIEDIQGVYVPFWMFDCEVSGHMEYTASSSTRKRTGNKEITTTKHYEVKRSGKLSFEKVPVDASTKMPDGHMDSIEPYDYRDLKEFSMAYMPGFLADKYDVEALKCGERMQERCSRTFEEEVGKTVTGYDEASLRNKAITVKKGAVHYAMLPVWLLATKWNNQNFLFAMNGQNGKLVGDLPMDQGKFWGTFGGLSVVFLLLMQLFNLAIGMTGSSMLMFGVALPILAALVVVLVLKGQLTSVRPQKAAAYIAGSGLKLTRKEDIFVRTSTNTRVIESKEKK